MKLKDLFEQQRQQRVIKGDVLVLPMSRTTLVGYKHDGIPIAGAVVTGFFNCFNTKIKSLEGSPGRVGGDFNCSNTKIKSLEGVSEFIGGWFYCAAAGISSLHNIHKQIKHVGDVIYLPTTIKSHILGVMFIKGLREVAAKRESNSKLTRALSIINKHLRGDRNIHECQEELIEVGLKEYARL